MLEKLFRFQTSWILTPTTGSKSCHSNDSIMFIPPGGADSKGFAKEVEEQRLSDSHAHSGGRGPDLLWDKRKSHNHEGISRPQMNQSFPNW